MLAVAVYLGEIPHFFGTERQREIERSRELDMDAINMTHDSQNTFYISGVTD